MKHMCAGTFSDHETKPTCANARTFDTYILTTIHYQRNSGSGGSVGDFHKIN